MKKPVEVLSFRVPAHVKMALDEAAAADHRPTANLCGLILERWLKEHGFIPDDKPTPDKRRK